MVFCVPRVTDLLRVSAAMKTLSPSHTRLAAWILLCALGLWAAMCGPMLLGRVYTSDDLGAYHLPLRHFYAQCLARGESFDWCPSLYCGFYLSGEGQVGMYHPLHWMLYRCLSLQAAFGLELLLSYPLMLAGCWLFFQRHVKNAAASMIGAVVFTFCGFNTLHFVHPHAVAITAHLPWLLWCWGHAWQQERKGAAAWATAGIALLTASQLLLGYPQYVWFSLLAQAVYVGFLWRQVQPTRAILARCSAALALGILTGAVQWLPTWDWLGHSQRQQVDSAFALSGGWHPLNLVQIIAPYLFETRVAGGNTHELGLYIGAAPLLLALWLLGRAGGVRNDAFLKFALTLTVLAFVLALGARGGLYFLQTWLPLIGKFRLPARYLVLVHFGLATVVAVAMARLLQSRPVDVRLRSLIKPLVASLLLALAAPWVWPREAISTPWLLAAGPALLALAAGAMFLCLRGRPGAYLALAVLTVLDLGAYGLSYAVYPNTVRLSDYLAAGSVPPSAAARVVVEPPGSTMRTGNHLIVRGCPQADGYAGLEPNKQLDYRQTAALRVAGVQWVLDRESGSWTEVSDPLPRVRLVERVLVSHRPGEDLARIDVGAEALVEQDVDLNSATLSAEPALRHAQHEDIGEARILRERPGELQISADAPARRLLVIAESFHPGWDAKIDGRPADVLRVNGDFMGCVVEAGRHGIDVRFQPASLIWGQRLSLVGLVGIGVLLMSGLMTSGSNGQRQRWTEASLEHETERELALVN